MQPVELEPWALGVRFREEPQALRRYHVGPGSPADGVAIDQLDLGDGVWISLVNRAGALLPITRDTVLQPGDEIMALVDPAAADPSPHFQPSP
jgi:cell volume regulation protein A